MKSGQVAGNAKALKADNLKQICLTQKSRDIASAIATFFVSLVVFLCLIFIPVKNKKFTEIRIQLDAPEVEKPKIVEPPKVEEPKVEEQKVTEPKVTKQKTPEPKAPKTQEKKVEKPVEKTQKQTVPEKSTSAPKPSVPAKTSTPIAGRKSVEELTTENSSRQKTSQKEYSFDDSLFADDSNVSQTSKSSVATKNIPQQKDVLSGTAATSNASSGSAGGANSTNSNQGKSVGTASSGTMDSLNRIASTTTQTLYKSEFSDTSDDIAYTYSPVTSSRGVKTFSPIVLSEGTEKQFERTLKVKIIISFDAAGFVTNIEFSPADTFPRDAMNEIRAQLSRWQFESGNSAGHSEFSYTVEVSD